MLTIRYETNFKKDYKRLVKRGYNIVLLSEIIELLAFNQPLDRRYKDHPLIGDYKDCRDCHITPDWVLIYRIDKLKGELVLIRTGTHNDVFSDK